MTCIVQYINNRFLVMNFRFTLTVSNPFISPLANVFILTFVLNSFILEVVVVWREGMGGGEWLIHYSVNHVKWVSENLSRLRDEWERRSNFGLGSKSITPYCQVALQLYWNRTSACVSSCIFDAYFQNTLLPLEGCFWRPNDQKITAKTKWYNYNISPVSKLWKILHNWP